MLPGVKSQPDRQARRQPSTRKGEQNVPQHYHTRPALLEGLRCLIVQAALSALLTAIWLVTRALPEGHPVRVFMNGRVPQMREDLIPAVIPSSEPNAAVLARYRRLWLVAALALAGALIGDVSANIPFDLFGLPDTHLGIGSLLGFHGDDLVGTPHIFKTRLPWNDGSSAGTALLLTAFGTIYGMRPRFAQSFD